MKHILFCLTVFLSLNRIAAQIVFCPPGAEWHYRFSSTIFNPGTTYNVQIKYLGDSVNGTDTFKVLGHSRFFMTCGGSHVYTSLIRQKGDTVFFKNALTQNTWQILYNFAALPGQGWQTVLHYNNTSKVFTFSVSSVATVMVNGTVLRQLTITYNNWAGVNITERIGSSAFLFHFSSENPAKCDNGVFLESLCYQDNTFGLIRFSENPCDYSTSNYVGLHETELNMAGKNILVYPNPAKDQLHVEWDGSGAAELSLSDISGRVLKRMSLQSGEKVDLRDLNSGVYLVSLSRNKKLLYTTKLIKVD